MHFLAKGMGMGKDRLYVDIDRQDIFVGNDVMLDAGRHLGGSEVLTGGLEEIHRGFIFERR